MHRLRIAIGLLLCVGLIAFYTRNQERIDYQDGHPYDSETYWHQARLVAAKQPIRNWKPFVYRMGAPYVVGKWYPDLAHAINGSPESKTSPKTAETAAEEPLLNPNDPLDGYTLLGFLSACIIVVLLFFILRQYGLSPPIALFLVAIYIANPNSPFRFSPYFPAFADPLAFVFFFGMYLAYKRDRAMGAGTTLTLCMLGFSGAFVREIVLLVPLTFLGAHLLRSVGRKSEEKLWSRTTGFHLLPILCIVFALYMTRGMVTEAMGEYSTLGHAQAIWQRNWHAPEIFPLACMVAIGPFFIWLLTSLRESPTAGFLKEHPELPLYLVGMAALSITAGNHTDRFVFWMLPATLPWLGFLVQERVAWPNHRGLRLTFFALLIVAQLLTYRAWAPIPAGDFDSLNYPGSAASMWLAPYGEGSSFGGTIVAFMGHTARMTLLWQFALLSSILLGLLVGDHWLFGADQRTDERAPKQKA